MSRILSILFVLLFTTMAFAASTKINPFTGKIDYTGVETESDPIVGAINGIIKADGAGNISAASAGTDYIASESDPIASPTALSFSINGWGQTISTTPVWHQTAVPSNMTITSWSLDGDVSGGNLEVDVQVSTSSPYTSYSSICASAKPIVTGAYTNTSSTLTGWTTNLTEGTRVRIVPSAGATHKKAQLTLFGDKT